MVRPYRCHAAAMFPFDSASGPSEMVKELFCVVIWLQGSKWPELNWKKKAILRVLVRISSRISHMSNVPLLFLLRPTYSSF